MLPHYIKSYMSEDTTPFRTWNSHLSLFTYVKRSQRKQLHIQLPAALLMYLYYHSEVLVRNLTIYETADKAFTVKLSLIFKVLSLKTLFKVGLLLQDAHAHLIHFQCKSKKCHQTAQKVKKKSLMASWRAATERQFKLCRKHFLRRFCIMTDKCSD